MREKSKTFINFSAPRQFRLPGQTVGLAGRRAGALFFARHLDYFAVTRNSQPLPGLGTLTQLHADPWLRSHLPGPDSYREAKNEAPRPFAPLWAGSDGT
jgi:hypothetical protein